MPVFNKVETIQCWFSGFDQDGALQCWQAWHKPNPCIDFLVKEPCGHHLRNSPSSQSITCTSRQVASLAVQALAKKNQTVQDI